MFTGVWIDLQTTLLSKVVQPQVFHLSNNAPIIVFGAFYFFFLFSLCTKVETLQQTSHYATQLWSRGSFP